MYLDKASVESMLDFLHTNSHSGSFLVLDYFTLCVTFHSDYPTSSTSLEIAKWEERQTLYCGNNSHIKSAAWRIYNNHLVRGEPLKFGIEREQVPTFLSEHGFVVAQSVNTTPSFFEQRFLTWSDGSLFGNYPSYLSIVVAENVARH